MIKDVSPARLQTRLWKTAEVAALLSVKPPTVTGWARSKKVRSIRLPGGHYRFDDEIVVGLLKIDNSDAFEEVSI